MDTKSKTSQEEAAMFAIIDTHTNEAVVVPGTTDPRLFDDEIAAATWAASVGLDGRDFAIVDTDEILNEEA